MWTIRQEQTEAFRQHHLQKFEDEMVEHSKKFAPQLCKAAGEKGVRQVIRLGMDNARTYGLTNRGPVRFYIELMFAFGSYFDTDPQYPWAKNVLKDPQQADQKIIADRLWAQSRDYFVRVFGGKNEFMTTALQRLKATRLEEIGEAESLEQAIMRILPRIHPEKCDYLGVEKLTRCVQNAFGVAEQYGLTTRTGRTVVVGLALAVGHRFAEDPLWTWTKKRMSDDRFPDGENRAQQLYSAAMLYLDFAIAERNGN